MHQGLKNRRHLPVAGPWITQKEIEYVADAVTNAWYGSANIYHERFERTFAEYIGVRYAISLPSCTSAIHLSLLALGIGPGDEVIVPDITWIATAAPISYVGATPVFADIDPETWCLHPGSLASCITSKTRAVMPVDLYGGMPDMETIRAMAECHGLAVIEDAAEAVGSEYRGRRAGSFGDTGVFSFHGSKTLTTGEGGMLVTDRADLYERALFLRDHGRKPGDTSFFNTEVAYKYRMSNLQAALGLAQIERIDELVARKRQIFAWYAERLSGVEGLALNVEPPTTRNSYWMVTAIVDSGFGLDKTALIAQMAKRSIDCRPFFYPLSALPAYSHLESARQAQQRNVVSYRISPFGINLPSALSLTEDDVEYTCKTLIAILQDHSTRRAA
ncbi:MAG TPA: DegT/DnrJ/EryC1/StrS family aminotransferase [Chthonomonadales bacterium]|nr:DegT/DnrJ/EryC1/StrS family aminotransferase [Chthonomonadales bacterium]